MPIDINVIFNMSGKTPEFFEEQVISVLANILRPRQRTQAHPTGLSQC